jgi:hypothetical protein
VELLIQQSGHLTQFSADIADAAATVAAIRDAIQSFLGGDAGEATIGGVTACVRRAQGVFLAIGVSADRVVFEGWFNAGRRRSFKIGVMDSKALAQFAKMLAKVSGLKAA